MNLTDMYTAFHPKEAKYKFFSTVHGTFSKIDHMIGHKASLNKFKNIEIISSIFFDDNDMKLEINYNKKSKTLKNTEVKEHALNNDWVKKEITEEIKNFLETSENELRQPKTYGTQQRQS